jgi:hypothetical protein
MCRCDIFRILVLVLKRLQNARTRNLARAQGVTCFRCIRAACRFFVSIFLEHWHVTPHIMPNWACNERWFDLS